MCATRGTKGSLRAQFSIISSLLRTPMSMSKMSQIKKESQSQGETVAVALQWPHDKKVPEIEEDLQDHV